MDTVLKFLIGLCCLLLVLLGLLATFFVKYKPAHRPASSSHSRASGAVGSAIYGGSSNRSRMSARWAHMEQASRRERNQASSIYPDPFGEPRHDEAYDSPDDHEILKSDDRPDLTYQPDDFGGLPRFHDPSSPGHPETHYGSLGSSLVGEGPNGTRTFLKGWFGLDEPSSAGYNTRPSERPQEKSLSEGGDVLPMRATNHQSSYHSDRQSPVITHHRVPTNEEDPDWESRSQTSNA